MIAIDLFAGLGGFSDGAKQAGCRVVWAADNWPLAVEWHARNHPEITHACHDLHQTKWIDVPAHDLLLASPACQGHSKARGRERPHHDAARSTAWAIVAAAECHKPAAIVVENVPEFERWTLFPVWKTALEKLGYALTTLVIDAANHGVPQNRKRLFVVAVRSRSPINLDFPTVPSMTSRSVIEWESGTWSPIERPSRSQVTLARIAKGREQFGDRFVAPYYGSGSGLTGRSLDRPLGTITTRDRWAVVDETRMRMLTTSEARKFMGFPERYQLPTNKKLAMHLLGNAVCPPVARDLIRALKERV